MSRRIDYHHDPEAPAANSIVPSANVAVTNDAGEILLIRRSDNDNLALPGGAVDLGDEGGGDVDEGYAAEIAGGYVAGYVAYYSAADGDEEGFAVGVFLREIAADGFYRAHVFFLFGVVEEVKVFAGVFGE